MAYTLADMARIATEPLKKGVVDVFRRESFIMDTLRWETVNSLSLTVLRTKTLPDLTWRKIGETWVESKGVVEPIQERVFNLGGYIDVDKVLLKADTIVNQRALQTDMFTTAFAYAFNDSFINGQPSRDEDEVIGLFYRIRNFLGGTSGQEKNLNGLDISPDSGSLSASFETYMDGVQELIHMCEGHQADVLMMNSTLYLRTLSALRQKGLFATDQDNYGRTVATWGPGGPKIIDLGYKADGSTKIITDVELSNGSALTGGGATSVYAARLGEKYLMGIQLYPLDVQDVGLLENGVAYRTVVDWPVGIYMVNPRSVARLSGIIAA
jgi:hypothetical protein